MLKVEKLCLRVETYEKWAELYESVFNVEQLFLKLWK